MIINPDATFHEQPHANNVIINNSMLLAPET